MSLDMPTHVPYLVFCGMGHAGFKNWAYAFFIDLCGSSTICLPLFSLSIFSPLRVVSAELVSIELSRLCLITLATSNRNNEGVEIELIYIFFVLNCCIHNFPITNSK